MAARAQRDDARPARRAERPLQAEREAKVAQVIRRERGRRILGSDGRSCEPQNTTPGLWAETLEGPSSSSSRRASQRPAPQM
jgi:hypothetical protein